MTDKLKILATHFPHRQFVFALVERAPERSIICYCMPVAGERHAVEVTPETLAARGQRYEHDTVLRAMFPRVYEELDRRERASDFKYTIHNPHGKLWFNTDDGVPLVGAFDTGNTDDEVIDAFERETGYTVRDDVGDVYVIQKDDEVAPGGYTDLDAYADVIAAGFCVVELPDYLDTPENAARPRTSSGRVPTELVVMQLQPE